MDSISKTLSNPYVLGGGVLVGLFLMLSSHRSVASTGPANTASTPAYLSAASAFNIAASHDITSQLAIKSDLQKTQIQGDVTKQVAVLSTLVNFSNNAAKVQAQQIISNQGIIQSQLQTQAAIVIDINNNATRLSLGQEQVNATKITSDANTRIAEIQAKAIKHSADASMFTNILKDVVAVAAAPFTGGASLVALGTGFGGGSSTPTGSGISGSNVGTTAAQAGETWGLY